MDSNKVHAQPEQGLTEEQVEKASITLWQIFGMVRHQTWGDLAEGSKEVYRERTKKFAPYLQFAPAQLPGDVIEGMKLAWRNAGCGGTVVSDSHARMTAAAQVLLDRPEVLGPVTNEEWEKYLVRDGEPRMLAIDVATLIAKRRDSLLKPAEPTMEEAITNSLHDYECLSTSQRKAIGKSIAELVTRRTSGGTK